MAILSNINGKFAVEDTGAIRFSNQTGTTGQILKSNGNAAPTWVDGSTVIGGPYLPLAGGILTGATSTASGISFTVGGALTGTTATFTGAVTGQANSNTFGTASASGRALIVQAGSSNQAIRFQNNLGGDGTISATGTATTMNYSFGTYSVAALFIQNDGNVGIGTDSPATKLHLGGTAPGDSIIRQDSTTSGTNWEIGERVAGKWQIFEDDGNTIVTTFMSTGNVGIGTVSPQRPLHVNGTEGVARFTSTASGNNGFEVGIGTSSQAFLWQSENSYIQFATNNVERMRIDSSGNATFQESIIFNNGAPFAAAASIRQQSDILILTGGGNGFAFNDDTNTVSNMRIDSGGNVGIGTTGGGHKLEVNGGIRAGIAGNASANTPALKVYAAGASSSTTAAIAIQQGTTEGDTILFADYEPHVEWGISCQNSTDQIHFTAGSSTNNLGSKTVYNNAGNARTAYIKFNHDLTDGTTLIGGNLGLGVTSPAAKLHISGTSTQLMLETPNSTNDIDFRWRENGTNKWNIRYQNATEDLQILNQIGPTIVQMHFESSDSRIGIGNVSPTGRLTIEDGIGNQLHLRHSSTASYKYWNFDVASDSKLYIVNNGGTGVYIADGATSWTANSDESLKENIKPLNNVLDKIKDYRCVEYNLKTDKDKKIGFIAQDWENDFAPIVDKNDKGLLGMKYTETIPVLLKAIQELKAEIEILKNK